MAMDRKSMASMRAAALNPASAEKKPEPEEVVETYEVSPEQLATLQDEGEVELDSGCTLKLKGEAEPEEDAE